MNGFCFKVENTLKAELSTANVEPSDDEIYDFLAGSGLDLTKIMGFYRSTKESGFFIKFAGDHNPDELHQFTKLLNASKGMVINGTLYKVITSIVGEIITNFFIHNLPFEISDDILRDELNNYGTVQEIIWQTVKKSKKSGIEIFNGIRSIKMQLQKPIPPVLNVMDVDAKITYKYQDRICDECMSITHANKECIEQEIIPKVVISNATRPNSESGRSYIIKSDNGKRNSIDSMKEKNRVFMIGDIIKYVAVKI